MGEDHVDTYDKWGRILDKNGKAISVTKYVTTPKHLEEIHQNREAAKQFLGNVLTPLLNIVAGSVHNQVVKNVITQSAKTIGS